MGQNDYSTILLYYCFFVRLGGGLIIIEQSKGRLQKRSNLGFWMKFGGYTLDVRGGIGIGSIGKLII